MSKRTFMLAALAVSLLAASPAQAKKPAPTYDEVFAGATVTTTAVFTPDAFSTVQAGGCWTVDAIMSKSGWWGYWEYGQRTNWCHNGSWITYRYTQPLHTRAGGMCSPSGGVWFYKAGGGVGDWYVDVRAGASFSCYYINGSPWAEIRYTQGGSNWQVAGSDG